VNELPEHMLPLFTDIEGTLFTVTVAMADAVETQPLPPVPDMEYDVVAEGETTKLPPEIV